ncbi:MAG TPA: glycosyl transferase [Nitrosomonas halophila]|nr:glycosyl transferase [Nitrosomonas halophila]
MTELHIFTSAALNYIPKVRILARSIREHHPEAKFHLALADMADSDISFSDEPFDSILRIDELDIPSWRGWTFCHRIVELATAIKPFALRKLLQHANGGKVLYIDPDIVVFSRLDDLLTELDSASLVLTPHLVLPESNMRGIIDNEISGALKHGIYNLGFAGVRADRTGLAFANWWGERCYHFCRDDIPNGLFTDQRWIDLAPALFPDVAIHRGTRHNVATWNISTRQVTYDRVRSYQVDGQPLGFYHFTGFDSGAHRIMAGVYGEKNQAIRRLIEYYAQAIAPTREDPLSKRPWAFSCYSDGTAIDAAARVVYRERVDLQHAFPDPFNADGYLQWWRTQAPKEYPQLFDAKNEPVNQPLTFALTAGYSGGKRLPNDRRLISLLGQALKQPALARSLISRTRRIWQEEGWSALIRRIRN